MPTNSDKRVYQRKNGLIIAEYTTPDGKESGLIRNISAGGLFIRTDKKPFAGQSIVLRFPLFNFEENISVSGKVLRIEPTGFVVKFDKPIYNLTHATDSSFEIVNEVDR
jgi:Tfp pilus assembly protein PilZ